VDGDTLAVASVTQGSDGTVTNNGTDVTYTPNADFSGLDSFTYTVSDGNGGTDTATVSVTVNAAPITMADIQPNTMQAGTTINVAITGSSYVAGADVTFENGNGPTPVAANIDVAPDGNSLTASINAKKGGPPRNRVWDVRVTNPDGSSAVLTAGFTVTP
jgi:hypothetical protein